MMEDESDPYFDVQLVFAYGPWLLWVHRSSLASPQTLQIGLYGVRPTCTGPAVKPATLKIRDAFYNATRTCFRPIVVGDQYAIQNGTRCYFGSVRIHRKDGSIEFLEEILLRCGFVVRVDNFRRQLAENFDSIRPNPHLIDIAKSMLDKFDEFFSKRRTKNSCLFLLPHTSTSDKDKDETDSRRIAKGVHVAVKKEKISESTIEKKLDDFPVETRSIDVSPSQNVNSNLKVSPTKFTVRQNDTRSIQNKGVDPKMLIPPGYSWSTADKEPIARKDVNKGQGFRHSNSKKIIPKSNQGSATQEQSISCENVMDDSISFAETSKYTESNVTPHLRFRLEGNPSRDDEMWHDDSIHVQTSNAREKARKNREVSDEKDQRKFIQDKKYIDSPKSANATSCQVKHEAKKSDFIKDKYNNFQEHSNPKTNPRSDSGVNIDHSIDSEILDSRLRSETEEKFTSHQNTTISSNKIIFSEQSPKTTGCSFQGGTSSHPRLNSANESPKDASHGNTTNDFQTTKVSLNDQSISKEKYPHNKSSKKSFQHDTKKSEVKDPSKDSQELSNKITNYITDSSASTVHSTAPIIPNSHQRFAREENSTTRQDVGNVGIPNETKQSEPVIVAHVDFQEYSKTKVNYRTNTGVNTDCSIAYEIPDSPQRSETEEKFTSYQNTTISSDEIISSTKSHKANSRCSQDSPPSRTNFSSANVSFTTERSQKKSEGKDIPNELQSLNQLPKADDVSNETKKSDSIKIRSSTINTSLKSEDKIPQDKMPIKSSEEKLSIGNPNLGDVMTSTVQKGSEGNSDDDPDVYNSDDETNLVHPYSNAYKFSNMILGNKNDMDFPFSTLFSRTTGNSREPSVEKSFSEAKELSTISKFDDSILNTTTASTDTNNSFSAPLCDSSSFFHSNLSNHLGIMTRPRLLAHSRYGIVRHRWTAINCTAFQPALLTNLRQMIESPRTIQTFMWPAIMRGHSLFAVGPSGCGNTLGIVPPLCSLLLDSDSSDPKGPMALIVCSNNQYANDTLNMFKALLMNVTKPNGAFVKLLMLDDNVDDFQKASLLYRGCDVLITTPSIMRVAEYKHSNFDLTRLTYLTLMNVDILEANYRNDVSKLIELCRLSTSKNPDIDFKIYAESKAWCGLMHILAKDDVNPVVCITALQEVALYAPIRMKFSLLAKTDKLNQLVEDFAGKRDTIQGCVIVCNDDKEVDAVTKVLEDMGFPVISMRSTMDLEQNMYADESWKSLLGVLVCTDINLSMCDISKASMLINYSLPSTFTTFYERFSCFIDTIPNMWNDITSTPRVQVTIYADETNELQLPKLIKYLKRCGANFDEKTEDKMNRLIAVHEKGKISMHVLLCDELLNYGACKSDCKQRHLLDTDLDSLRDYVPQNGYIHFDILHMFNVLHYSVRILEHISLKGERKKIKHNSLNTSLRILVHYLKDENRKPLPNAKVGDWCCAELKPHEFYRGNIIKVIKIRYGVYQYAVRLIDRGDVVDCDLINLFELPPELISPMATVVNVRIAGLIPTDMTNNRFKTCKEQLVNTIFDKSQGSFMRGKIVLGFGDCLWLESVQSCQCLEYCEKSVVKLSVRQFVLENNMARECALQIENLRNFCKDCSFQLPEYDPPPSTVNLSIGKKSIEPQWAHLDEEAINKVFITSIVSPDLFFVKLCKWNDITSAQSKDMEKEVLSRDFDSDEDDPKPGIGEYCIAKYSDSTYHRARIESVDSEGLKCFFVDFGDWSVVNPADVYSIPDGFITKFPFQAIECRMLGVKPSNDAWTQEAIGYMQDMSFESATSDYWKVFVVWTSSARENPSYTGSRKYAISLFDLATSINEVLVEKEYAEFLPSEKDILKDITKKALTIFNAIDENEVIEDCSDDEIVKIAVPHEDALVVDITASDVELIAFNGTEWECNFDANDFQNWIEPFKKDEATTKLVEIPNNFTEKNLDTVFKPPEDNLSPKESLDSFEVISSNHKTPNVRWSENKEWIFLQIDLIGVVKYTLDIEYTTVHFHTVVKCDDYEFKLNLMGYVKPKDCLHSAMGLYVSAKLAKVKLELWYELVTGHQPRWITYDPDKCGIYEKDDEHLEKIEREREMLDMAAYILDREDDSNDDDDIDEIDDLCARNLDEEDILGEPDLSVLSAPMELESGQTGSSANAESSN